jgi:hypothetical protein
VRVLRFARVIAIAAVACAFLCVPTVALAHSSSGELASWSPHGNTASGVSTKMTVGCSDEVKRTFYVSSSATVFVNTNGAAKTVSRNVLFHSIHHWFNSGDCPDLHMHWIWNTRSDGTHYRFVTRLEAANRID